MFQEYVDQSATLVFTSEIEEEGVHKLVLKVDNETKWMKQVLKMLKAAEEGESFGVAINKEYFLNDEGNPTYIWVCTFWGDLEEAAAECGPILAKRFGPPAPPKSVAVGAKAVRPSLANQPKVQRIPGGGTAVTIPLPHTRGSRNKDKDTVVRALDNNYKGIRATVEGVK